MPFIVPRSSARYQNSETDSRTVQMEEMTPAIPPGGFTPTITQNPSTKSPLLPRNTWDSGIEDEFNTRTLTSHVQAHGRRSRIPRPRPRAQARSSAKPIDGKISCPEDAGVPVPTLDEERKAVPEPVLGMEVTQVAQPPEQATYLEPSNCGTSANTSVPNKETQTRGYNYESASITPLPPAATTMPVDAPDALDGHVKPRRVKAPKITVTEASDPALEENSTKTSSQFDRGSYLGESRVPSKRSRKAKTERPASPHPFTSHEAYESGLPHSATSGIDGGRNVIFDHDEPLTPTELPYAGAFHSPCVIISDSWLDDQSDMEREAEERAERDLAAAGKLFDDFGSTLGGSATSAFPLSSFVTTSNMSIVSYDSDSESGLGDANGTELRLVPQIGTSYKLIDYSVWLK
jgi:hypothetical protein